MGEIISTSDMTLQEYCVYLRGDNIPLGQAELESFTRSIGETATFVWDNRFGKVKCNESTFNLLMDRMVLMRMGGKLLFSTKSHYDIEQNIHDLTFAKFDNQNIRFAVRVLDFDSLLDAGERGRIASMIGKKIGDVTKWPVSLSNPDVTFVLYVTKDGSHLCEAAFSRVYRNITSLAHRSRPFFHPSMMNVSLASVMCNLAGVMPGQIVLDPFCGAGGILIEAARIGSRVIGMDLDWRLLNGAKVNLHTLQHSDFCLIKGDAQSPPLFEVECIVTDPPYGRSSSTHGSRIVEVISSFLTGLERVGGNPMICMCGDSRMNLGSLFLQMGGYIHHQIRIRVHRGLIREIFCVSF